MFDCHMGGQLDVLLASLAAPLLCLFTVIALLYFVYCAVTNLID